MIWGRLCTGPYGRDKNTFYVHIPGTVHKGTEPERPLEDVETTEGVKGKGGTRLLTHPGASGRNGERKEEKKET